MAKLVRFGVSVEAELLDGFDKLILKQKYSNRSQAIAALMRNKLIERNWQNKYVNIVAIISLVYNHHKRELVNKVMDVQHDFQKVIISSQHIHLDHDNCLEIIACRGKNSIILDLSRALGAIKGIKHTSLSLTSSGK
ncbi:MAG: nickel-responsive transcriptional regulator NikR [Candidatus Omnitrophica bacterium]|nr:nickel-responsive transcriptional regulator NikR [Candidatus Omnitrophota bacterium]